MKIKKKDIGLRKFLQQTNINTNTKTPIPGQQGRGGLKRMENYLNKKSQLKLVDGLFTSKLRYGLNYSKLNTNSYSYNPIDEPKP